MLSLGHLVDAISLPKNAVMEPFELMIPFPLTVIDCPGSAWSGCSAEIVGVDPFGRCGVVVVVDAVAGGGMCWFRKELNHEGSTTTAMKPTRMRMKIAAGTRIASRNRVERGEPSRRPPSPDGASWPRYSVSVGETA
jgi:hypothetical protein